MKLIFQILNPGRNLTILNSPTPLVPLCTQHDAVSPFITDIDCKSGFVQPIHSSEIEFFQLPISLHQFGELDIFVKLNNHGVRLDLIPNNFRARLLQIFPN